MSLAQIAGLPGAPIGTRGRLHLSPRRWLAAALTAALLLAVLWGPLPVAEPVPQTRTISITARTFEFEPGVVHVNRGDTVVVRLESSDVVHGLYLDGYGLSTKAEPGQPGGLTFLADRAGAYHFRCAVPCGNLHPFMIGKLVVDPNLTWLRAVLASVFMLAGSLAFFWRR